MSDTMMSLHPPIHDGSAPRSRISGWLRACSWSLAGAYILICVCRLLAFNVVVESVYRSAFVSHSFSQALVIGVCALEGLLAILFVYEVALPAAAMMSLTVCSASFLFRTYILWSGELEPIGCAGRVLKSVQGWEHLILLALAGAMLVLSTVLYLGTPKRGGRSKG